jgi:hypothetical protein
MPSQKSDNYLVHMCFNDSGHFVPTLMSQCECPAGQYFDLHMLGSMLIAFLFQRHEGWLTEEHLMEVLPVPIKTLCNVPVPWSLIFVEDTVNKKAKQEAKIVVGNQRREESVASEHDETAADEDAEMQHYLMMITTITHALNQFVPEQLK